ncbi:MAG: hypothetical protein LBB84_12930 [Tannerellaceae bacterium]|nr:hypothetical protein [Tannerellaceae bacterium]
MKQSGSPRNPGLLHFVRKDEVGCFGARHCVRNDEVRCFGTRPYIRKDELCHFRKEKPYFYKAPLVAKADKHISSLIPLLRGVV